MYDKYLTANKITINTKIPKHKGILITANTQTYVPINVYIGDGSTMAAGMTFAAGTTILPMEIYSVGSTFGAGITGFYLN